VRATPSSGVIVAALLLFICTSGCFAGPAKRAPARVGVARPARTGPDTSASTVVSTTTTIGAGALPQTGAFPSAGSVQFQTEMSALWSGIVTGSPGTASPAFFPERAYEQLKSIYDAQADYVHRLLRDYSLDITAAHDLIVAGRSRAVFVRVDLPAHYGHWIPPGICDNRSGYFEVANSRVVYEQNGVTRSFGIASLISWRGVWYVVHLGAILRATDTGLVENPEIGPGTSAPSSTC